jgi:hypothetical protein
MKTENILRKLKEFGFVAEFNENGFETERGTFFVRVNIAESCDKENNFIVTKQRILDWMNGHQLYGIREGKYFYCQNKGGRDD